MWKIPFQYFRSSLRAPLTEVNRNRTVDPEGACVLGKIMSDEGCDDDDEILVTKESFPENFFQAITLPGQSRGENQNGNSGRFHKKTLGTLAWRGLLRKLFKQNDDVVVKCECGKDVRDGQRPQL